MAMGEQPKVTLEDDWLPRRVPPTLRSPERLKQFLQVQRISIEQFKRSSLYLTNVKQFPWLRDL